MFEPTIKDIAQICGVGVSTVSRAINNHPDINSETKEKIMSAIREYGYVPNDSARNLKRVDAKAIAVLVKGIANPFFTSMITVIEQECKKRHYSMELSHIEADEDEVDVAQKVVKEKRLRGIIFLGGLFSHSEEKLKNSLCRLCSAQLDLFQRISAGNSIPASVWMIAGKVRRWWTT